MDCSECISWSLVSNKTVVDINLTNNIYCGDEGAEEQWTWVQRCVDVVVCVVCEIEELPCTVSFGQALAEMLEINRTITHLNLQSWLIGVEDIKAQRIDFGRSGSGVAF